MAEYLALWWDTDQRPPEYVRGHVSEAEAREAVQAETGCGDDPYTLSHRWGRWEFPGDRMRANGCDRVLVVYDEKQRGCFAVTELRPLPPTVSGEPHG